MSNFDDIVIGTGMGGLSVGALLAKSGRRVLLLEAHDVPGGYAHTFRMRDYRFCAQVHYIFNCGEGETIHRFLDQIGLAEKIPFLRLDVEGFDHVVVDRERIRIPSGLPKFRDRLLRLHPESSRAIRDYFKIVEVIARELDELDGLPERLTAAALLDVYRYRHVLRYLRWTLDDLYDHVRMPPRLRALLAGQCGDYLLPPRDVSLLLHVALIHNYDRGAYYPKHHFFHFVESIVRFVMSSPGCEILFEHEVDRIHVDQGRVVGVTTTNGRKFTADRYISNVDPQRTAELVGSHHMGDEDKPYLDYEYSCGTFTMYLGLRGVNLTDHGFGSFNVWHYPHEDLNRIYDDQLIRHDLSNPWLFLSTPTMHSDQPGLCPPGHQILEIATACDHAYFEELRRTDRRAYNREKKKIGETILDILEARYIPNLREHLAFRLSGSPTTNERYCWAPAGNAYGARLTPAHVGMRRKPWKTSLENLWMVNATAGLPSVAGTISAGMKLHRTLS
ncbi:MAG: phytoene desaturase family protein [Polyangiaceae bacterium]